MAHRSKSSCRLSTSWACALRPHRRRAVSNRTVRSGRLASIAQGLELAGRGIICSVSRSIALAYVIEVRFMLSFHVSKAASAGCSTTVMTPQRRSDGVRHRSAVPTLGYRLCRVEVDRRSVDRPSRPGVGEGTSPARRGGDAVTHAGMAFRRMTTPPLLGIAALIVSFLLTFTGLIANYVVLDRLSQTTAAPSGAPKRDPPGIVVKV